MSQHGRQSIINYSFQFLFNPPTFPVIKEDLNTFPPGKLETTRTPSHHVDEDYPAGPGII